MYIRETITKNKKTKTKYSKHQLIESIRTEKGPRQRIVMELGTLALPKSQWRKLAALLEARLAGQLSLFEDEAELTQSADKAMNNYDFLQTKQEEKTVRQDQRELVNIDMNSVETALSRSLGPELVAHTYGNA